MEMASKIIVVGDVDGQLADVFGKLSKLHGKNSFAFAIVTGSLFANADDASDDRTKELLQLLQGEIKVPLPTYFALGKRPLPSAVAEKLSAADGELCQNLFVLGRKVSMKTSEGFKLVAVGGSHVTAHDDATSDYSPTYTDDDAETAQGFKEADILITTDWPSDVQAGSGVTYAGDFPAGSKSISKLCTALKPRYHLSASDAFFEREPFFHQGSPPYAVTRFISLAPLNNSHKQKAMYAFSLEPSAPPPLQLPPGCTGPPFLEMKNDATKRKLDTESEAANGFRFANGYSGGHHDHDRDHRPSKRRRQPRAEPAECFFCLAGTNVGTHMITSIGEDVYMTTAKGPLTTPQNFPTLHHPLHLLLIPLQHAPTFAAMPAPSRAATLAEMHRYRDALHALLAAQSTDGPAQLGAVTWEIARAAGVHLHWQFVPVPADLVSRGLVEAAFDVEAENASYAQFAKTAAARAEAEAGDYFKVMIWSEGVQKELVLPLEKGARFDLQFGRRVLGKLLRLESRTHWKDCVQTEAEEAAEAEAFKGLFEPYDPAREGAGGGE